VKNTQKLETLEYHDKMGIQWYLWDPMVDAWNCWRCCKLKFCFIYLT